MLNNSKKENMTNKRGQVGESVTWIIATIVLIGILMIFIFISVALSKTKSLEVGLKEGAEDSADWINSKTQMAYSISASNKNKIQGWISQAGKDDKDE
jgi:flagellar biosynthesis protein FlhB